MWLSIGARLNYTVCRVSPLKFKFRITYKWRSGITNGLSEFSKHRAFYLLRNVLIVCVSFIAIMIRLPLRGVDLESIAIYARSKTVLGFKRLRIGLKISRRLVLRWINNGRADQGHPERKKTST